MNLQNESRFTGHPSAPPGNKPPYHGARESEQATTESQRSTSGEYRQHAMSRRRGVLEFASLFQSRKVGGASAVDEVPGPALLGDGTAPRSLQGKRLAPQSMRPSGADGRGVGRRLERQRVVVGVVEILQKGDPRNLEMVGSCDN